MKKRPVLILLIPILIISLFLIYRNISLEKPVYNSKAIYVYNLDDDKKVISINENEKLPIASLTKIMTVLVGIENVSDPLEYAPIDIESYQKMVEENASMAGFFGNEMTTYRDLFYGAMLPSGGEAADSIAINISGDIESFVNLMNEKAASLDLKNTFYKTADGMDKDGSYSTSKDVAMLLKYALSNESFREIFTSKDYLSGPTADHPEGLYMQSTVFSKLINFNEDGFEIIGGKSGTTDKAGLCLATLAVKDDKEYIIVTLGVPYDDIDNTGDGQIIDTLKILESL